MFVHDKLFVNTNCDDSPYARYAVKTESAGLIIKMVRPARVELALNRF